MLDSKNLRGSLSNNIINLDGIALVLSKTVRTLRVIFNKDPYIKHISKSAFFQLFNITKIRQSLTQNDAEKCVQSFVTSWLEYCNFPLSGCTIKSLCKTLQLIQNIAACIDWYKENRSYFSCLNFSILAPLEIKNRVENLFLTSNAISGLGPSYLIMPYYPTKSLKPSAIKSVFSGISSQCSSGG